MKTSEELRKIIESGIESNTNVQNAEYNLMLEKLWMVIFDSTLALVNITEKINVGELPEKEFACMLILTNCLVDAHSSYHSMRAGFHRAAAITSRGMLENMALAIALKGDESDEIFRRYKNGKYDIPNAVAPAKNFFPEIGPLYGILTNKFAHEPYETIGRAFSVDGTTTILHLVPPAGRDNFLVQFTLIVNLAMLMSTMGQAFEWTFANFFDPEIFWERLGEKELKRKNAPSFQAIQEMTAVYEAKLKGGIEKNPSNKKPGSGI